MFNLIITPGCQHYANQKPVQLISASKSIVMKVNLWNCESYFITMAQQPKLCQGLLII